MALSRDYSRGAHALGAHIEFWPWESASVLMCSVWFVGYDDGYVFFFIFLSL